MSELSTPWGPLALELDDSTAALLIDALLAEDLSARRDRLTQAIRCDPAFALWAFWQARHAASDCVSLAAAADHLAPILAGELARPAGCEEAPQRESQREILSRVIEHACSQLVGEDDRRHLQRLRESFTDGNASDRDLSQSQRTLMALARRLARSEAIEGDFDAALRTEKLEALRQFAYGAGHEINNPLANISARAQTLLAEERDPERRRKLAAINSQAFRAYEMISDLMLFARPPRPNLAAVDLRAVVRRVVEELTPQATAQNTTLAIESGNDPLVFEIDSTQIAVAVRALVLNAMEALGQGGEIRIAVGREGATATVTVADNGPGLSAEARRHLFDPFYSGREAGRGLGLGLSKCWTIVKAHGGRIDVESEPGCGAKFAVILTAPREAKT